MLRTGGQWPAEHSVFANVRELLRPGDLLVVNDARVVNARIFAQRATGGRVEIFVLGTVAEGRWETDVDAEGRAMLCALTRSSKRLRAGEILTVTERVQLVVSAPQNGEIPADLRLQGADVWELTERAGLVPLPPYIVQRRRALGTPDERDSDCDRYQTVYASTPGAVAAPTAGLHFTPQMLDELRRIGVGVAALTLRVGAGTFRPVTAPRLSAHTMHTEYFDVPAATAAIWEETRRSGGRVVAVGTTVVRALEAAFDGEKVRAGASQTTLLIRPGYRVQTIDAMITNFHLPHSTLLALVSAFGGYQRVRAAYAMAIASGYRFYSYGDAMWIERAPEEPF